MIKAVLFDIDGTLVDSNEAHVSAWAEAFRAAGHEVGAEAIRQQMGKGADMLVPTLRPGASEEQIEALGQGHGKVFKERFLDAVPAFPGAAELLARVHASGRKVVLASSASGPEVEHYVGLLGAKDVLAATTSADDVENTKPAPDIFAVALARVAPVRAEEAIVVGDTPYDVEAAARCGIRAVALRSGGFADEVLTQAGAAEIHDDAAALLAAFDRSALAG